MKPVIKLKFDRFYAAQKLLDVEKIKAKAQTLLEQHHKTNFLTDPERNGNSTK